MPQQIRRLVDISVGKFKINDLPQWAMLPISLAVSVAIVIIALAYAAKIRREDRAANEMARAELSQAFSNEVAALSERVNERLAGLDRQVAGTVSNSVQAARVETWAWLKANRGSK